MNVDDHTLLSRVNIFYTLEELIESTLCVNEDRNGVEDVDVDAENDAIHSNKNSSPSQTLPTASFTSTLYPCPPPQSPSAKGLQLLTRAAMKLFIFLALQVATSGEREMSYIVSKFVAISLKRARSGKKSMLCLYLHKLRSIKGLFSSWMLCLLLVTDYSDDTYLSLSLLFCLSLALCLSLSVTTFPYLFSTLISFLSALFHFSTH